MDAQEIPTLSTTTKRRPRWESFDQLYRFFEQELAAVPADMSQFETARAIAERIVAKYQISREVQHQLMLSGLIDWISDKLEEEAE